MIAGKSLITLISKCLKFRYRAKIMEDPVIVSFMRKAIENCSSKMSNSLSVMSGQFSRQIQGVLTQRLRRTIQIIKLCEELGYNKNHLKQLLHYFHQSLLKQKNSGRFLSLLGAAAFNLKGQEITEEEVQKVAAEMDFVEKVPDGTEDKSTKRTAALAKHFSKKKWEVVFQKSKLIAWRQAVSGSNVYKYKLYGSLDDIPARAFYHAQLDIDYRKKWDKLILGLEVIEDLPEDHSQVVYWKMQFLYPFYPRDYVFVRKFKVDKKNNIMYTMSQSISHPDYPVSKDCVRVDNYFSNIIIRPHTTFDENGFDYILTYYDDPKCQFPSMAYNWLASTGVPNFVEKMYTAARYLHLHKNEFSYDGMGEDGGEVL